MGTCRAYPGHMANMDELKGRTKEAAGDLTDDEDLKREGKVDQTKGKAKEKLDEVSEKVKGFVTKD